MNANVDPSRTTSIRNAGARQMRKRFRELSRVIRTAVATEDVFGLKEEQVVIYSSEMTLNQMQTPGRRAFGTFNSSEKIAAFMRWLKQQVNIGILELAELEQVGTGINAAWTNVYLHAAYGRGLQRARLQMRQAGYSVPELEATGGLNAALSNPFHIDRLGLLYTRAYTDLVGVTTALDTLISRVLTQGVAEGMSANSLARLLQAVIEGGGQEFGITDRLGRFIPARTRAEMVVRTEMMRAFTNAQLQEFLNWRVVGVNVKAEWITAGDNRVCNRCANLEGSIYSIEEAWNLIPLHPRCRCIFIPTSPES